MWRDLINWFRLAWDTGTQTQKNTVDIEEISKQGDELAVSFDRMSDQQQHDREMMERRIELAEERIKSLEKEIEGLRRELRDAQEKTELKIRLAISEYLRQLPPPDNSDK